ncbi:rhomboid family intramembrane serine protease [Candidatus Bathyarchaeota archaeon]|nr:rhomboid family intramembrane serine protease [Candidatus Bathyarchaeota archaeon]
MNEGKSSIFGVTTVLMVANILVYIGTSVASGNFFETSTSIMATFGQLNILVIRGWYWQLFSSLFIHANITHLVGNMLFLLIFGFKIEGLVDNVYYLVIYFAAGLLGNLLSLLLGPQVISVGASGAIFGLFGAYTAYLGASLGSSIILAIFYGSYMFLLNVRSGVNILAHFGGLVAGILIGLIISKKRKPEFFEG